MSIFFVLLSMIAFGLSNVIWKPLLTFHSSHTLLFRRSCWSAVGLALLYFGGKTFAAQSDWYRFLVHTDSSNFQGGQFGYSLFYILLSLTGLYLFIYSLLHQPAGIAGMVVCTSTLLSAFLGWFFNGEKLSQHLAFSMIISVLGVLLLDGTDPRRFRYNKGLFLAILGACCWGIANLGFKRVIPITGVLQFSVIQEMTVLTVSGLFFTILRKKTTEKEGWTAKNRLMLLSISLCTIIGVVFCNLGLKNLPISTFALLVLAQPLTTFLFATFWLKEKTSWLQKTGAVLILAGIYAGTAY